MKSVIFGFSFSLAVVASTASAGVHPTQTPIQHELEACSINAGHSNSDERQACIQSVRQKAQRLLAACSANAGAANTDEKLACIREYSLD